MFRRLLFGGLAALTLAAPAGASIITLTVSSGGIDDGRVCNSLTTCGAPAWVNNTLYGVTGTITIDTSLNTATYNLFADTSVISGSSINGVTALTFDDTTYSGTVDVVASAGPGGSTYYTVASSQNLAISVATLSETGGGSAAYSRSAVRLSTASQCLVLLDGTGQCGVILGPSGSPTDTTGQYFVGGTSFDLERFVKQTMNLGVVPEPGPLALMLTGVVGLLIAGRRRAR